jgi:hypothetical protein
MAQFNLLSWVSGGCKDRTYEGTSYRVSARALHNRGLIRVEGRGPTWTTKITAEGARLVKEQALRVEAERERERREEEARAERERESQRLRARALEVLEAVTAAGGRLALATDYSEREVTQITDCLARGSLLPNGQRFAHEPTRMDPILGVTAYLEHDFATLTPTRAFKVPQQLRGPHAAVTAFQEKRQHVSRAQIPRAARYLQGLVNAVAEMGWSAPSKVQVGYAGRSEQGPDLSIKLPLQRDTGKSTLEDQLPALVRVLEIGQAESDWARQEEERRSEIREDRWKEVKKGAFVHLAYERNAKRLLTELDSRDATAAMRTYADEIDARASALEAPAARAAREWAEWIREHAERTDPLNGLLRLEAC